MAGLTIQEKKALQLLKQELLDSLPGKVKDLKLFGSKARGEANKFSDIDVFIVLNDKNLKVRNQVHHVATNVFMETDVDLAMHIFTTDNIRRMRKTGSPLLINVEEEGVAI